MESHISLATWGKFVLNFEDLVMLTASFVRQGSYHKIEIKNAKKGEI